MTLTSWLAYSVALFVAAAIPGPGITALVARALGQGFRSSYPMAFGLILGDLVYLTAVVLGLAWLAQSFGMVFLAIKYAGVAYLLYIAWQLWHAGIQISVTGEKKPLDGFMCFLSGLAITLGNPKTMLFYIGLMPALVDLEAIDIPSFSLLVVTTFVVLLLVVTPYMMLAGRARHWIQQPQKMRLLNRTAAGFIGGAAAMIIARG